MHIELTTTATVAKAINIKREKDDSDNEIVVAHLKFENAFVTRDQLDEFCNQPIGWSTQSLYLDTGNPRLFVEMAVLGFKGSVSGVLRGPFDKDGQIRLARAKLTDVVFLLTNLGARMAGHLSWLIAGDEASDAEMLLGKECALHIIVHEPEQGDWVKDAVRNESVVMESRA